MPALRSVPELACLARSRPIGLDPLEWPLLIVAVAPHLTQASPRTMAQMFGSSCCGRTDQERLRHSVTALPKVVPWTFPAPQAPRPTANNNPYGEPTPTGRGIMPTRIRLHHSGGPRRCFLLDGKSCQGSRIPHEGRHLSPSRSNLHIEVPLAIR
jgi:hypothetical protein